MHVLGISCYYHDSAATLISDGNIIAAAQEERFSRKKHDNDFPTQAIRFCLSQANIQMKDVNAIAFYEKPLLKFERLLHQNIAFFPKSYLMFVTSIPSWLTKKLRIPKHLQKLGYTKEIYFIDHHLSHAANAYLMSPYSEAAIITADGVGEWTTTSIGIGKGETISLLKDLKFPHSLGMLYSTITAYLGFSVNNSEYKVMGLSAYGTTKREDNKYYHLLKKVIDIAEDGSYRLDLRYFCYHYKSRMPSQKLCQLLEGAVRKPNQPLTQRHYDIAAAVQLITEEAMIRILKYAHSLTHCSSVVLSGGVALNSVFNGKILSNTPFQNIWIPPDPADGGSSMGVAAFTYSCILNKGRTKPLPNSYLGPGFSDEEILAYLNKHNISYELMAPDDHIQKLAELLNQNNIVAHFEGRMEWGPRALGNRSILANPTNPEIKNILNLKVKHREEFRPFAPVICTEDAPTYFECDIPLPQCTDTMLLVYPIRKKYQSLLPAVTHVDGTGRLQTVTDKQHPFLYSLLQAFEKKTGMPVLINTSFNIRGEPIVCTPQEAYRCMMGTGIDYLSMGSALIAREKNLKDAWNSESLAND